MRKRAAVTDDPGKLSGGLGDVNPQVLKMTVTQGTNDQTVIASYQLGPSFIQGGGGKAIVIEVLKFQWDMDISVSITATDNYQVFACVYSGNNSPAMTNLADIQASKHSGQVITYYERNVNDYTTVGVDITEAPAMYDMTDGAGHGVLIPPGALNLKISTKALQATGGVNVAFVWMFYRFKQVSLEEYFGIVQTFGGQ
jgi:hypothetical protein